MLHDALSSSTEGLESFRSTLITTGLNLSAMVTPMAAQPLLPLTATMHRKRHIAVRALHNLTAATATQETAISAPGHQHHSLFACLRQCRKAIH
jgi:hypothetical protein